MDIHGPSVVGRNGRTLCYLVVTLEMEVIFTIRGSLIFFILVLLIQCSFGPFTSHGFQDLIP
jgi:hypothetical protein